MTSDCFAHGMEAGLFLGVFLFVGIYVVTHWDEFK